MNKRFQRTKFACYSAYFTMTSIFSLPPLLFVTFHEMYGISYTLLGTLVLVNFCTQLSVDLLFTFFSKYINPKLMVRMMPIITSIGLALYALSPVLFPSNVYIGLLMGTVIFSVSAGLSEVLLSPVIAAIPSENPQRDMSLLHSLYAFGVLTVVAITTLYFAFFDRTSWTNLTLIFAALPVISAVLFMLSPMPDMSPSEEAGGAVAPRSYGVGMLLCVLTIFFGSCAENVMASWVSGYMENALHIDKSLGDILGMALFAVLLGAMRIGYARFGKRIMPVLMVGMIGSVVCYLTAGLSSNTVVALVACALTGLFTSMLWPGSLIMMEENIPGVGVAAYALMAAGGDLGASVAPQLMGIVVDTVSAGELARELSLATGMTVKEIGLKAGMLLNAIFPLIGIIVLLIVVRYFGKRRKGGSAGE